MGPETAISECRFAAVLNAGTPRIPRPGIRR